MCTGWAQLVGPSALGLLLLMNHSSQVPLRTQCCGRLASKTRLLILKNRGFDPAGSRVKFHVNVVSGSHIGGNVQRVSGMSGVSAGNHVSRFTTSNRNMTFPMSMFVKVKSGGGVFGPVPTLLTLMILASVRYTFSPGLYLLKSMITS